jgi:hypothetical protein
MAAAMPATTSAGVSLPGVAGPGGITVAPVPSPAAQDGWEPPPDADPEDDDPEGEVPAEEVEDPPDPHPATASAAITPHAASPLRTRIAILQLLWWLIST